METEALRRFAGHRPSSRLGEGLSLRGIRRETEEDIQCPPLDLVCVHHAPPPTHTHVEQREMSICRKEREERDRKETGGGKEGEGVEEGF